jgi:hypothetical protein
MPRDAVWDNKDGLVVGFGTRTPTYTGSYSVASDPRSGVSQLVYRFRGEDLSDAVAVTEDQAIMAPVIPNGSILLSATLYITEAFVGATGVLDVGVYNGATEAAVDDDGIVTRGVAYLDAAGVSITCDGADIATTVATAGGVKICASYDTAAFTAGEAICVVNFIPSPASS